MLSHLHALPEGSNMLLKLSIALFTKDIMPQNPRPYNSTILNKATIILIIHRRGVKIFVNHDNYSQRV